MSGKDTSLARTDQDMMAWIQRLTTLLNTANAASLDVAAVGKEVRRIESNITMRSAIIAWKEQRDAYPQFSNMSDDQGRIIIRVIKRLIERFLSTIRCEWNEDQRVTAAVDIFYKWQMWTIIDIVNFIKYARTNPENKSDKDFKIYPNSFSPVDLLRFSAMYEDCRAREHEQYELEGKHNKNKVIPDAVPVEGEDGIKTNLMVGSAIKLLAKKTGKVIKADNAIDKARHERDVQQQVIDSYKSQSQLAQEKRDRLQLVNQNTKKMFPGTEDSPKKKDKK